MHEPRLLPMTLGIRIPQSRPSGQQKLTEKRRSRADVCWTQLRQRWVDSETTYMNQKARNRVIL